MVINFDGIPDFGLGSTRLLTSTEKVPPYGQSDIAKAVPHFLRYHPRLLVFDGENFAAFSLKHKNTDHYNDQFLDEGARCFKIVPMLVEALKANNPGRFEKGQPVFQILFTDSDVVTVDCVNKPCGNTLPPILAFGSVPKVFSHRIKAFPTPPYIDTCLWRWKTGQNPDRGCHWAHKVNSELKFEELTPQIIWRGRNHHFLSHYEQFRFPVIDQILNAENHKTTERATDVLVEHWRDLTPRWRLLVWSLRHPSWVDSQLLEPLEDLPEDLREHLQQLNISTKEHIDSYNMSEYKYQIDLGGM